MSAGLLALVDDLTALAKVVAASVDDAAGQAAQAGGKAISKASGIVIDDAAVTPRYVIGYAADRELPIIARIAKGSLRNKLLILTPAALALNALAPWALTPLLMAGGAFLAFEGFGKVMDTVRGAQHGHDDAGGASVESESAKVASAVRTDFILSAEIMAITLATVAASPFLTQALVLVLVGIGMTLLVYGAVALIVKADDAGAALARTGSGVLRALGRGIVAGMPVLLSLLGTVGMLAMLWVGGGIITHGLHELGVHGPEEWLNHVSEAAGAVVPAARGAVAWLVKAALSAVIGLAIGAVTAPVFKRILPGH